MAFNVSILGVAEFSLAEARLVLEPLVIFIIGMVIYAIFIFKLYRFISRRNIFKRDKRYHEHEGIRKLGYVLEYIFLFPIVAFIWFFVIATILSMISQVLTVGDVFMISMAVIMTIRITAYYSEELSRDIAKLLPFALLAIFLLDISTISITTPLELFIKLSLISKTLAYYFMFLVVVEFIFRGISSLKRTKN
jgi:hypothetical protein